MKGEFEENTNTEKDNTNSEKPTAEESSTILPTIITTDHVGPSLEDDEADEDDIAFFGLSPKL